MQYLAKWVGETPLCFASGPCYSRGESRALIRNVGSLERWLRIQLLGYLLHLVASPTETVQGEEGPGELGGQ